MGSRMKWHFYCVLTEGPWSPNSASSHLLVTMWWCQWQKRQLFRNFNVAKKLPLYCIAFLCCLRYCHRVIFAVKDSPPNDSAIRSRHSLARVLAFTDSAMSKAAAESYLADIKPVATQQQAVRSNLRWEFWCQNCSQSKHLWTSDEAM